MMIKITYSISLTKHFGTFTTTTATVKK